MLPMTVAMAVFSGTGSLQESDTEILPLVPKPKSATLSYSEVIRISGEYQFPVGRVRYWSDFTGTLSNRFSMGKPTKSAVPIAFDGGVSKLGKRPGAYEITIRPNGRVSVLGEEDEGLRNGLRRVAMLAFLRKGQICLPTGTLFDEPELTWRGVHLVATPGSRARQMRLWKRVLLPLGMNKVVLQIDAAQWQTSPSDASLNPIARQELADLFQAYRNLGVEPIPLIESVGPMPWLFGGGKRDDLSLAGSPMLLDYRRPESIDALRKVWVEAIELLKPSTLHFGGAGAAGVSTEMWKLAMPELQAIAGAGKARMLIWGEGASGPKLDDEAAERRRAIPKGAWVVDRQFANGPEAERYYPALQVWKRDEIRPIAGCGSDPENVRGVALAANLERVGFLQSIPDDLQVSSVVLGADYAWSGRQESLSDLGYRAEDLFRQLMGPSKTLQANQRIGSRELEMALWVDSARYSMPSSHKSQMNRSSSGSRETQKSARSLVPFWTFLQGSGPKSVVMASRRNNVMFLGR